MCNVLGVKTSKMTSPQKLYGRDDELTVLLPQDQSWYQLLIYCLLYIGIWITYRFRRGGLSRDDINISAEKAGNAGSSTQDVGKGQARCLERKGTRFIVP